MKNHRTRKSLVILLSLALTFVGLASSGASAAVISTGDMIQEQRSDLDRAELQALLNDSEVSAKLLELGVDPDDVQKRIDALTPSELASLNQQIDELPAGSGVVGILLTIFIVFVITDVLGATDIFPFIHPVR